MLGSGVTFNNSSLVGLLVAGNWINNGTFSAGSGTVTFNGTAAQTIGGANSTAFNNLTINNTSAGVTLGIGQTINGALTLTNGRLTLNANDLTLASGASISGASSTSYVVTDVDGTQTGRLCKQGLASAFTYPIGDNRGAAEYSPVTFTPTGGSGLTVCFRTVDERNSNVPSGLSTDYLTRYWVGDKTAGTFTTYDVSFTFIDTASDVVGSTATMLPKKWDSGPSWAEGGTVSAPTVSWTGLTGLSQFTAFKGGVLAVDLAAFTADATPAGVALAWETVSETANAGFNLYRADSAAGPWAQLNPTLIPAAAPGSSEGHAYTWLDATAAPDATYWYLLEDVALAGAATRHPPVLAAQTAPASPNAVGLAAFRAAAGWPGVLPLAGGLAVLGLAVATLRRRR